jgi:hypothetical protein
MLEALISGGKRANKQQHNVLSQRFWHQYQNNQKLSRLQMIWIEKIIAK